MTAEQEPNLRAVVTLSANGAILTLTVTPRAARNQLVWQGDNVLRLRITAPPVEGAANTALLKFLARALGLARSQLTLASGESSRHKRVLVQGVSAEELMERLHQAIAANH